MRGRRSRILYRFRAEKPIPPAEAAVDRNNYTGTFLCSAKEKCQKKRRPFARAFGFPKQELQWGPGSGSSAIEEGLAAALDPIAFQYGFFQATGGLAFTF